MALRMCQREVGVVKQYQAKTLKHTNPGNLINVKLRHAVNTIKIYTSHYAVPTNPR